MNNLIDFSILGDVFTKTFDKDTISIGRSISYEGDGWEMEGDPRVPLYEGIPCHVEPSTMDNPDVSNAPTNPIITTYTVYAPPSTDVKNGDYITMYIRGVKGEDLEIVTGIAGEPRQYTSRIEFSVGVAEWT